MKRKLDPKIRYVPTIVSILGFIVATISYQLGSEEGVKLGTILFFGSAVIAGILYLYDDKIKEPFLPI